MSSDSVGYICLAAVLCVGATGTVVAKIMEIRTATAVSEAAIAAGLEQRVVKVGYHDPVVVWVKPGTKTEELLKLEK